MQVEHDWQLTDVDRAIMHWFMRELCRRCTLEEKDIPKPPINPKW